MATSPSTAIGRLVENEVLVCSVPLPSVRLLKTMPFAAWTLARMLLGLIV